jgi:hypothetical protein
MEHVQITKPARRYVAKALPLDTGGYLAHFAFPGVPPRYVLQERPCWSYSNRLATQRKAARACLFDALNSRPSDRSKRERYRLMSGAELADMVRAVGITPTFFCYLWGCSTERFFSWVDETPDKSGRVHGPPHGVRLLLETWLRYPETLGPSRSLNRAKHQRKESTTGNQQRRRIERAGGPGNRPRVRFYGSPPPSEGGTASETRLRARDGQRAPMVRAYRDGTIVRRSMRRELCGAARGEIPPSAFMSPTPCRVYEPYF